MKSLTEYIKESIKEHIEITLLEKYGEFKNSYDIAKFINSRIINEYKKKQFR